MTSNKNRHRDEQQIVADILTIAFNGSRKTRIMYGANLSYALTERYLSRLEMSGLVKYNSDSRLYGLTTSGRRYLEEYEQFKCIEGNLMQQASIFEEKKGQLDRMLEKRDLDN